MEAIFAIGNSDLLMHQETMLLMFGKRRGVGVSRTGKANEAAMRNGLNYVPRGNTTHYAYAISIWN